MSLTDERPNTPPNPARNNPFSGLSRESHPTRHVSLDEQPSRSLLGQRRSGSDDSYVIKLVRRASETIDILQERCQRLDKDVAVMNDRLKSEAESSERVIKDWERLASAIKMQLSAREESIADLQLRLKEAEDRAVALEARALASEERLKATETRAQVAEQLATQESELASTFRETILETFGSGSRLTAALAGGQDS